MDESGVLRPVQVVMDGEQFHKDPSKPSGGSQKDFFAGDNTAFARHKEAVCADLSSFARSLSEQSEPVGFLHVRLRETALAKSHRPLDKLFSRQNHFALVGGDEDGDLIVHGTPRRLEELSGLIRQRAEEIPRTRPAPEGGKPVEVVSEYRSELGSIQEVRLHDRRDRVAFDADRAVEHMQRPDAIGGYVVDLFRIERDILGGPAADRLLARFLQAIGEVSGGIEVAPALSDRLRAHLLHPTLAVSVRLLREPGRRIELPSELGMRPGGERVARLPRRAAAGLLDLDRKRNEDLLAVLSEQALVRAVYPPLLLEQGKSEPTTSTKSYSFPKPAPDYDYPVVGVLDGGIAALPALEEWMAGSAGQVPKEDRNERHGTFIAGLCAGAYALNPALAEYVEAIGVKVYDLDLLPRRDLIGSYYASPEVLFDQIDESVRTAKEKAGVRVINFSWCDRTRSDAYSLVAEAFDSIARKNDVIFVVSAGNLEGVETRPPWPEDPGAAVQMLAAAPGHPGIMPPAEAFHAITVGAINPPGVEGHAALLPTTYSRRGPGTGYSRKPDLAHIGGADTEPGHATGLASLGTDGAICENCGTSFASPSVASTMATLDQRLERHASREMLHALSIHRARRAPALEHPMLRHIAPEFVGFGMPMRADEMLVDMPYEITLVFDQVLPPDKVLDFDFAWPQCLVTADGKCRGEVALTLVYTPPIDRQFKDEALRVELDAHLRQETIDEETGEIGWAGQLEHDGAAAPPGMKKREKEMLRNGVKWSAVKRLFASMPKGRGVSSNWRLMVEPLTRKAAEFPSEGVRFALLLTIRDPKQGPVNDEMRNLLRGRGISLNDIHVAARVKQRAA